MKLSEIGERAVVRSILDYLKDVPFVGDDCACIPYNDKFILVTTDIAWRKTHFPQLMKPEQIGWFVVATSLSDIAAMGGYPLAVLLSIALPRKSEDSLVLGIVKGAEDCARRYGIHVVGGDTKEHSELTVGGVAIGEVDQKRVLLRKGLQQGDLIAVTNQLGGAGAAYIAIEKGLQGISYERLIKPIPRIEEGIALSRNGLATSCMDISDGLASTLYQLMEINGFGFRIYKEKLPIAEEAMRVAKKIDIDAHSMALFYGGDYELIFSFKREKLEEVSKALGDKAKVVGEVIKEEKVVLVHDGEEEIIPNVGYEHFCKENFL